MLSVNRRIFMPVIVLFLLTFAASAAMAEWSTSPYLNNPVDILPETADLALSVPDGNGGLLVIYSQPPNALDSYSDLWAQRLDSDGNPMWGSRVLVRDITSPEYIFGFEVISDGAGGAYIAMNINGGTYSRVVAQHIDNGGGLAWAPAGIDVAPSFPSFDLLDPVMALDGSGGVFVAWQDYGDFSFNGIDIYAQRLDAAGSLLFGGGGLPVCTAGNDQTELTMARDGAGGFYIAWEDRRSVTGVYGQRMDGSGAPLWTVDGILLSYLSNNPSITEGGAAGGFILVIQAETFEFSFNFVARKFNPSGVGQWLTIIGTANPVLDIVPSMLPDNEGGAYIAFSHYVDSQPTIFVQALTPSGAIRWPAGGIAAGPADGDQENAAFCSDGAGGVVLVWEDQRHGATDLYGQRIDAQGNQQWGPTGIPVGAATGEDIQASLHQDGERGFLVSFLNNRSSIGNDVFAQRVDIHGQYGNPAPTLITVADHPQDQGGVVRLEWDRSYLDDYEFTEISDYTIWRQYGGSAKQAALSGPEIEEKTNQVAAATGLDKAMVTGQLKAGWSYVDQIDASFFASYAYEAPTFADSTASGVILTDFKILAHASQFEFWESNVLSGYSVDNLAPGAPGMLMATYLNPNGLLEWSPYAVSVPDFLGFRIYRSDVPGFSPEPANFIGATPDTVFSDDTLAPGIWYYLVTAEDYHNTESPPSNQAMLQTTVSAVGDQTPAAFRVTGAVPNPFNPSTKIHFSLAQAGHTTVDVFDARGRLVRRLMDRSLGTGRHDVTWDGRDDGGRSMPSGVYLAQVRSGDERGIKKMILAK